MSDLFVKAVKDYKRRVVKDLIVWEAVMLILAPVLTLLMHSDNSMGFVMTFLSVFGGLSVAVLMVSALRFFIKIQMIDLKVSDKKFNLVGRDGFFKVYNSNGNMYSVETGSIYNKMEKGKSYKCLIQGSQIIHLVR